MLATAAGTAIGLRKLDYERMPQVAMLSSAFFVASLIHVSLGGTNVHLVLNGLVGLVLGWAAFPALLVALFLQAVIFGFGGPTTLGINTLTMAIPAVLCYYFFRQPIRGSHQRTAFIAGFGAGALAMLLSAVLTAGALVVGERSFAVIAQLAFAAHVPIAVVEGLITASAVVFLRKVRPELLQSPYLVPTR
jgi:cobalt/nickel transport system permease protein